MDIVVALRAARGRLLRRPRHRRRRASATCSPPPKCAATSSARTPMLRLDGVSVSIGPVAILRKVSLEVGAGEFAGPHRPQRRRQDDADAHHHGHSAGASPGRAGARRAVARRAADAPPGIALGIGYMPEDRRLVPGLSVEENVLLPAWASASPTPTRGWRESIARSRRSRNSAARKALQLSGGQQKLVALGARHDGRHAAAAARRALRGRGAGARAAPRRGDRRRCARPASPRSCRSRAWRTRTACSTSVFHIDRGAVSERG